MVSKQWEVERREGGREGQREEKAGVREEERTGKKGELGKYSAPLKEEREK